MHRAPENVVWTWTCLIAASFFFLSPWQSARAQSDSKQSTPSSLPRSDPHSQGVRAAAILEFVQAADETLESLHSVMIVRHGKVIAEGWWAPYDANTRHQLYSLSKSFTSTAVGMAVAEGKLSLDDSLVELFPMELPESPSPNLKSMRVRDLLRMSTGQDKEPSLMSETEWIEKFLAQNVPFKPGTHFMYNTPATYMCSAAVQKRTGQTVLDFLQPRLFQPLGIENPTWPTSPEGVTLGGYGLSVRTEDIAKFGLLYLNRGQWNGQQLIPSEWVQQATDIQTSNGSSPTSDWDQGYGYQFWRCRHGAYRGDGAFGQYCLVLPQQDAVIAITAGLSNMQAVLDLVWGKLLPGFEDSPLPQDAKLNERLSARLQNLVLPGVKNTNLQPTDSITGKSFHFPENAQKLESLRVQAEAKSLELGVGGHKTVIPFKSNWEKQQVRWGGDEPQTVSTSAGWTGEGRCEIKICFVETPFVQTLKLEFMEDSVQVSTTNNVSFGPRELPAITGQFRP